VSRPRLDPDRRPHKLKRLADLVLEKPTVAEVQRRNAIRKQDERWRRHRSLRHIKNANPLRIRNARSLEINMLQEPIHLACRDPFSPFPSYQFDRIEE